MYKRQEFQFSLATYLEALKAACMRLKTIKAELQETDMPELVAAAGMWKFRCDNLKRDVMEQVKGMGDKMDWDSYYPGGKTPLDHVEISNYTVTKVPGRSGLWHDGNEHLFPRPKMERSTIDRLLTSLNSGRDGQERRASGKNKRGLRDS